MGSCLGFQVVSITRSLSIEEDEYSGTRLILNINRPLQAVSPRQSECGGVGKEFDYHAPDPGSNPRAGIPHTSFRSPIMPSQHGDSWTHHMTSAVGVSPSPEVIFHLGRSAFAHGLTSAGLRLPRSHLGRVAFARHQGGEGDELDGVPQRGLHADPREHS